MTNLTPSTPAAVVEKERDYVIFVSRKEARRKEKQLLVSPAHRTANVSFRQICYQLLNLAEKHIPANTSAIEDRTVLASCVGALIDLGFKPPISPALGKEASALTDIVRNSFEYRQLRNKMVAGLSVVADLVERPASPGTKEFQRGVKEGYRRARETAIMFLDDLDSGDLL